MRKLQSQPVVEEDAADVGVVGKEKLMQIRPRTRGRCVRAGVLNRIGHLTNYIQHRTTTVTNDRLTYIIIYYIYIMKYIIYIYLFLTSEIILSILIPLTC